MDQPRGKLQLLRVFRRSCKTTDFKEFAACAPRHKFSGFRRLPAGYLCRPATWLPTRSPLAEAHVAAVGRPGRASGESTGRREGGKICRERERIFVFGGPKPKISSLEGSRRFGRSPARSAHTPKSGFPPSRLPVVRNYNEAPDANEATPLAAASAGRYLGPTRQLLRWGLRRGSQLSGALRSVGHGAGDGARQLRAHAALQHLGAQLAAVPPCLAHE
jgi:hypothetical protein